MNHCLLEVTVKVAPTIRYTQDNQTAIAEMEATFEGLRADDPLGVIKVVGWGKLAQELQNGIQAGQKLVLEGRLRMNTLPRQDGSKEKKAEFTLSKIHSAQEGIKSQAKPSAKPDSEPSLSDQTPLNSQNNQSNQEQAGDSATWNSSPLIPDTDDIPF